MNSQADILRQTLEDMANNGNSQFQMFGFERTDVGVSEQKATKIAAKNILEQFPEEDSEDVKAYRALRFLTEYLEESHLNVSDPLMGYPPVDQLRSLRAEIAEKARSDITDRLDVDNHQIGFNENMVTSHISDPISKAHLSVSKREGSVLSVEDEKDRMAQDILEAPL